MTEDDLTRAVLERHAAGKAPDGRAMAGPYWSAHYDFRLEPAA
jgi:hydroxyquinol 1,2-dioxygenase